MSEQELADLGADIRTAVGQIESARKRIVTHFGAPPAAVEPSRDERRCDKRLKALYQQLTWAEDDIVPAAQALGIRFPDEEVQGEREKTPAGPPAILDSETAS